MSIAIFMHSIPNSGTISYYRLPNGAMVYRQLQLESSEDTITLEPLRPFIGQEVEIHRDGSLESIVTLADIRIDENGITTLVFEPELDISPQ